MVAADRPAASATTPRYSSQAFPAYRYRAGITPHPRRDPSGHSFGKPDPGAGDWQPHEWATLEPWLYAVDLFNHAYWWEAHEQLEALWNAAGRTTPRARFVQGLLKVAAALLHQEGGNLEVATAQSEAGLAAMTAVAGDATYMGVELDAFASLIRCRLRDGREPAILTLGCA